MVHTTTSGTLLDERESNDYSLSRAHTHMFSPEDMIMGQVFDTS